ESQPVVSSRLVRASTLTPEDRGSPLRPTKPAVWQSPFTRLLRRGIPKRSCRYWLEMQSCIRMAAVNAPPRSGRSMAPPESCDSLQALHVRTRHYPPPGAPRHCQRLGGLRSSRGRWINRYDGVRMSAWSHRCNLCDPQSRKAASRAILNSDATLLS